MIIAVSWFGLSEKQRRNLLVVMEESFGKPVRDSLRFWKRSCRVYFYYPRLFGDWTGAAICWNQEGIEYMDKLFVRRPKADDDSVHRGSPKGEGTRFLKELLLFTNMALVWRTDPILAERFYGRIPGVRTVARHGEYVYQEFHSICACQAVRAEIGHDALLGMIRIPSAF